MAIEQIYPASRSKLLRNYLPVNRRPWHPWKWEEGQDPTKWSSGYIAKVRDIALRDFFFFSDWIMRDPDDPNLHELHAEVCWITQLDEECGVLVPRYHLKSTLCTVAHSLWRLAKNQNTRILLKAATEPVAEGFLNAIKQHIVANHRYKTLFPEVKPQTRENGRGLKLWNTYSIECERSKIFSEPSILAVGAKTNLTGLHFDLAIYDDLMAEENAKNEDSINEIIRKFEADIFLMVAKSRRFLVGTRYDDKDLYGHLMDNREFEFYIRAANEGGKWIWPNPDIIAKIQRDKKNCTPYVYSCQMMNNPIDKDTQEFKSDFKTSWDTGTIRKEMENAPEDDLKLMDVWYRSLDIYLGLDPARAEKEVKRNSSIAMIAVGVDKRGREYLLEYRKFKGIGAIRLVEEWVEFIVKWSKYPVRMYGQEAQGGDNHLVEPTLKALKERKLPFSRHKVFIPPKQENKEERIRELQLPWENRLIVLHAVNHSEIEQEFDRFPRGREKDVMDIWSHLHREIRPKREHKEKRKEAGWRKRRSQNATWNWKTG
jgi:hypothetical protein